MPKKFKGENTKAVVAKARRSEKVAEIQAQKIKVAEDEFWRDDDKLIGKKNQRKEEKEKKKIETIQRKQENKELEEIEKNELEPELPKQKVTMYQLQRREEEAQSNNALNRSHVEEPLVENMNREEGDVVSASGIDAAVAALSVSDSPRPGLSMAAAYKSFEERRLPQLKKENATMRLSQLKQLLRKEWQRSPENPLNVNN